MLGWEITVRYLYEGWLKSFKTDFFIQNQMILQALQFFLFQSGVLHVEYIFLQRFINDSNTRNRLFCDIPFSTAAVAFLISSSEENLFPRSCLFSVGNAQKSHGAKSGLYGEYFSAVPPISVSAANATAAICGWALCWSKNHCFLSKSGLFFLMAPRKWVFRTSA